MPEAQQLRLLELESDGGPARSMLQEKENGSDGGGREMSGKGWETLAVAAVPSSQKVGRGEGDNPWEKGGLVVVGLRSSTRARGHEPK
ncbi:hypothetical protein PR202_ga30557 [Eleusine coracana subsp. coracana]|uniref:Uncharacterized protein n=1 Tax=Eleusine coracana subsp. coracana TaxID=191504 RepID=A0AAV5DP92_ELECO|nr:hypothetical protein PR202_ga30557 [Eleusine coracana subsp. coracana]